MRSYFSLIVLFVAAMNAQAMACPPDSIGTKIIGQNHFIMHKVAAHEGWYGIARRYSVPVSNLRDANKNRGESLRLNDTILVPINIAKIGENDVHEIKVKKPDSLKRQDSVVEKKDTSQKKVYQASSVNALFAASDKATSVMESNSKEIVEKGIATWISDDDANTNKYYALHRTAAIGTIIKVTNRMNNKYIFVKVVGVLPDTGDNTDMIIKVSKASAEKLGVRDPKFQCALSYMAAVAK